MLLCALAIPVAKPMQEQEEPPHPYPPSHDKQVDHCTNAKGQEKSKHFCKCHKEPGPDGEGCEKEDTKCAVYCRKPACHCFHPKCDS